MNAASITEYVDLWWRKSYGLRSYAIENRPEAASRILELKGCPQFYYIH